MNQHNIPYPIVSTDGKTTHVLVPIEDYLRIIVQRDVPPSGYTFFPYEVSEKTLYGISPLWAWREYLGLTQEEVARRMGITHPVYTQMEQQAEEPHRDILEKAAAAFGIEPGQLIDLYNK